MMPTAIPPVLRMLAGFVRRPPVPRIAGTLVLVIAGLWYLGFVARNCTYVATDSDASGYFNVARNLQRGRLVEPLPRIEGLAPPVWDPYFQQPLGYDVPQQHATRVTTYPVGYPLHLLAVAPLAGLERAGLVVSLGLAAAAGLLMLAIGREIGLPWGWSAAGAALLLNCPLFILFVLQPMSDVCATVWSMAAIWAALQARRHWPWAFAAGTAMAIAVLVRPTNALLLLPIGLLARARWRFWAALVLGGAPGAVFLAWYNHTLYGSALATGYGDVSSLFGLRFVPHNTQQFAQWITALLSPFVVVPALTLPWLRRDSPRLTFLTLAWVAAFAGFYVFYFHSGEHWWYLRFILPMFPALILAALAAGHAATARWTVNARWSGVIPLVVLATALIWQASLTRRLSITHTKSSARPYVETVAWMRSHAPANAIVVQMQLSGCFTYYTNFTVVRWDLIQPDAWTALRQAARAAGRPIFATLYDFEEKEALQQKVRAPWRLLTRLDRVSVWQLPEDTGPAADAATGR